MTQAFKYCTIVNTTTGEVIADKVKIAQTFVSRSVGLLDRVSLLKGEALVINPCNSIHMFFMKFSIDVLYLDKNNRIIKIVTDLKPWRLSQALFAQKVVELESGTIAQMRIKCGDIVKIQENSTV
jgi:uncharacterized protein